MTVDKVIAKIVRLTFLAHPVYVGLDLTYDDTHRVTIDSPYLNRNRAASTLCLKQRTLLAFAHNSWSTTSD